MGKAFDSGYELRAVVLGVMKWQEAKDAENKRHEQELDHIARQLKAIQDRCPHPLTDYFPDPSGNNDSETRCQICDKHDIR